MGQMNASRFFHLPPCFVVTGTGQFGCKTGTVMKRYMSFHIKREIGHGEAGCRVL